MVERCVRTGLAAGSASPVRDTSVRMVWLVWLSQVSGLGSARASKAVNLLDS